MPVPHPPRVRALLFDLDGTLYDQRRLRVAMARRLLTAHLRSPWAGWRTDRMLSAYRHAQERLRGQAPERRLDDAQLQLAARASGAAADEVAACVERWMVQAPLPLLGGCRRPAILDCLAWARRRDFRLGVVSDYPAAAKLEALGLRHWFDVVVAAQDDGVQRFKPDPTGLLVALQRLAVPAAEALYIGDRPDVDGETARRAGVAWLIVGGGGAADDRIDGFADIPRLLEPRRVGSD